MMLPEEGDDAVHAAPHDRETVEGLARRYLSWLLLTEGTRAERLRAEAEVEVSEEARSCVEHDADPLPLLDALVAQAVASEDERLVTRLGAGLVEEAVVGRPDLADRIAARCRAEPSWSEVVRGAWADERRARDLPAPLRALVTVLKG
ncbi:hypothetical protein H1Q78_11775 [Cellulosimicrobium cellulans]|uniref:hypothetical protein n=1 Tax=Cellulosimicrobium cellulans TaxID=1710 RepID=UPI001EDB59DC|nr:hypothetical protein [Cellulosimicrobium cellulans]UKJ62463.1 hypothetical protein H1Q78_11775 [Cellulosimicrobium cellulans]